MIKSAWSLVERLLPRTAASVLLILLAWLTNPGVVGVYTWGTLIYTLVVALSDTAMRQVVVRAAGTSPGDRFIKKYQLVGYFAIPTVFLVAIITLQIFQPETPSIYFWTLSPFALAGIFLTINIRNVGLMQSASHWRSLATSQLLGAALLLVVGIPVTLSNQTPLGSAIGVATSEFVVLLWCKRIVCKHKLGIAPDTAMPLSNSRAFGSDFKIMSTYSGLAWGQGQLDRILVGVLGGIGTLGIISFGLAVSRALGDAVASSTANVLRSETKSISSVPEMKDILTPVVQRGLIISAGTAIIMAIPGRYIFDIFLDSTWDSALALIPFLTLAVIPSVLSWCNPVLHIAFKSGKKSLIGPICGNLLAIPLALLAVVDIKLYAVSVVLREICLVLINYAVMGRRAPWKLFIQSILLLLSVAIILFLVYPDDIWISL